MNKKNFIIIEKFPFKNGKELLLNLKKNKIIFSPWIENTISKKIFSNNERYLPYKLYKINLKKDLNITKQVYLKDIYKKLKMKGYKLVKPEFAIYSRLLIKQTQKGSWIRFATPLNSMIDSDGIPHLPKIGFALNRYFLETYWAYPRAVFHPHNSFIVCKKI